MCFILVDQVHFYQILLIDCAHVSTSSEPAPELSQQAPSIINSRTLTCRGWVTIEAVSALLLEGAVEIILILRSTSPLGSSHTAHQLGAEIRTFFFDRSPRDVRGQPLAHARPHPSLHRADPTDGDKPRSGCTPSNGRTKMYSDHVSYGDHSVHVRPTPCTLNRAARWGLMVVVVVAAYHRSFLKVSCLALRCSSTTTRPRKVGGSARYSIYLCATVYGLSCSY